MLAAFLDDYREVLTILHLFGLGNLKKGDGRTERRVLGPFLTLVECRQLDCNGAEHEVDRKTGICAIQTQLLGQRDGSRLRTRS